MEENKVKEKHTISRKTLNIIFIIADILSVILTLILMYVIYTVNKDNNPNVLSGYWVGFIFIFIPIVGFVISYSNKLVDKKSYLPLMIISIISGVLILLLLVIGLTSI